MKKILNEIKGFLRLSSYKPTKEELKFFRSRSIEATLTNHPKNYPLQQFGISKDDSDLIIELIKAHYRIRHKVP